MAKTFGRHRPEYFGCPQGGLALVLRQADVLRCLGAAARARNDPSMSLLFKGVISLAQLFLSVMKAGKVRGNDASGRLQVLHRSPGHHVDGGSPAEIFEGSGAMRSSLRSLSITEDASLARPSSLVDTNHARALRAHLAASRWR
jgi:hypothetical protein